MTTTPFKVVVQDGAPFAVQVTGADLLAEALSAGAAAVNDLVGEAGAHAEAAGASEAAVRALFNAARLLNVTIPGLALAAILADETIPFRIPDDFSEMWLGTRRISHQLIPSFTDDRRAGESYVAVAGEDGRGAIARNVPPPVDPYADDVARYVGVPRPPLAVEMVLTTTDTHLSSYPVGYEQGVAPATRIPGLSSDRKGTVIAWAEARNTLADGDPHGIVARVSRNYGRAGSWEAQTLVASDFGVTGPDSVTRDNSFGNPTAVYDPVSGMHIVLTYWRRQDVMHGDTDATTAANGGETTSRILAFMTDGTNYFDLAGNQKALPLKRADMTDVTAAKPAAWGNGSPGPGTGLAHSSGDVYFTVHGYAVGVPTPRGFALLKLNRWAHSFDLVSTSPANVAQPNETGLCELLDGTGRILFTSRIEDNGYGNGGIERQLNVFTPATNSWDPPRTQKNLPDPQKAGCLCNVTRGPFEPPVIAHFNVAMKQSSTQGTLRHLTARLSWNSGYDWPTGRRIYDAPENGYMERGFDSWGNRITPLAATADTPFKAADGTASAGNGSISGLATASSARTGDYKIVITAAGGGFTVYRPNGARIGVGTVGTPFVNEIRFTLSAGSAAWAIGDTIPVDVRRTPSSVQWYANGGYSAAVEVAPGVVGLLFETSAVFTDGTSALGHCGFTTLTMRDFMEPRRD